MQVVVLSVVGEALRRPLRRREVGPVLGARSGHGTHPDPPGEQKTFECLEFFTPTVKCELHGELLREVGVRVSGQIDKIERHLGPVPELGL